MIKVVKDIPLIKAVYDYDVVLVGTGINNSFGNGFQMDVARNFPSVARAMKTATNYGDTRKLGSVTVVEGNPIFCLCYITKGRSRPDIKSDALEYDSLGQCLRAVSNHFKGRKIASTIIGESPYEGGGDRERIIEIIEQNDVDITLYDYVQEDDGLVWKMRWNDLKAKIGTITKEEYYEEKKKLMWEKAFGIYKPIPKELSDKEIKEIIKQHKNG